MALMDVFYPGNPGRREAIVRTHQQILDCLESNYEYANELTGIVNKHCGSSLCPIRYNKERTIKDTCDTFIARIEVIKDEVTAFQKELERKLGTHAFQKLSGIMESSNNGFDVARKVIPAIDAISVAIASIAAFFIIQRAVCSILLSNLCRCLAIVGASVLGSLVIGLIALGVDAVISAILGAFEREKLENTLAEYKRYLEDIKPASMAFQKSVIELTVRIESYSK